MEFKFNLFLFDGEGAASGSGTGAGEGAGVTADAAGQQMDSLGIPKAAQKKWAESRERRGLAPISSVSGQQTAGNNQSEAPAQTQAQGDADPNALTFDQIKRDPRYKGELDRYVSGIVQNRLAKSKGAETAMKELGGALAMLRTQYGIADNDNAGLAKAITDSARAERAKTRAQELGTDLSTAEKLVQAEDDAAEARRDSRNREEQERISAHVMQLYQQAEQLKQKFPNFDLERELENPQFVRWTAPDTGMSVEAAYRALHWEEIDTANARQREAEAVRQVTETVRAGQARPQENGTGISAGITKPLYSQMSKEQRAAALKYMKSQNARGLAGNYMDM